MVQTIASSDDVLASKVDVVGHVELSKLPRLCSVCSMLVCSRWSVQLRIDPLLDWV